MLRQFMYAGLLAALLPTASAQESHHIDDPSGGKLGVYLRTGRYADAREFIDNLLRSESRDDLAQIRSMLAGAPNLEVRRASDTLKCAVSATGVRLPLTIGNSRVEWLVDTGANVGLVSDAEARRLGLVVTAPQGRMADLAGGSAEARITVIPRMLIGRTQVLNATLLVFPSDQMPWKELPPGRQGIMGLPLLLALDALDWTRQGVCRTGSQVVAGTAGSTANISYRNLQPIVDVRFGATDIGFVLDTGNQSGTQLWERFGRDFEGFVRERGRKSTMRVTQMGGSVEREVTLIPNLNLRVGGKEVVLADAPLFSRPVGDLQSHGLLGMDVLSQAEHVTIDFRSMTLTLR